jgi:hypothetical protein
MSEHIQETKFFSVFKLWWWFVYTTMLAGALSLGTWVLIVVNGYDWSFDMYPGSVKSTVNRK